MAESIGWCVTVRNDRFSNLFLQSWHYMSKVFSCTFMCSLDNKKKLEFGLYLFKITKTKHNNYCHIAQSRYSPYSRNEVCLFFDIFFGANLAAKKEGSILTPL